MAAVIFAAIGCGDSAGPADEVVLTMQNISGIYVGATFTTEEDGVVTNQLRRGASIELILHAAGTTDGQLIIPPDTSGCCGVDLALIGTWDLSGNTVTLDHTEDSFLNGMSLVFEETHLTGEETVDGVVYRVVLAL